MTITITEDRYGGIFSRGAYTAWPCPVPEEVDDDDVSATNFWDAHRNAVIGLGASPAEALADLQAKQRKDAGISKAVGGIDVEGAVHRLHAAMMDAAYAWLRNNPPPYSCVLVSNDGQLRADVTVDGPAHRKALTAYLLQWADGRG